MQQKIISESKNILIVSSLFWSKSSEIKIDNEYVKTNILRFELSKNINQDQFAYEMKKEGILFNSEYGSIRMVTNCDVASKDIQKVIDITSKVITSLKK